MNARKSIIWWVAMLVWYGGAIAAFAYGASQEVVGLKLAWMGGSLAACALGVFVAKKIN